LRGSGVRVTTLCPGPIPTEFGRVAERAVNPEPVAQISDLYVPAKKAVAEALEAVERDRARIVPGWKVALSMALVALLPMVFLRCFLNHKGR
jgi:uncharacterized protein